MLLLLASFADGALGLKMPNGMEQHRCDGEESDRKLQLPDLSAGF